MSAIPAPGETRVGDMVVRPFRTDDAPALARFFSAREFDIPGGAFHLDHALNAVEVLDLFAREGTVLAVLGLMEDRIVGSFEIRHLEPDILWVCSLYVDPALHGLGLGTALSFVVIQSIAERSRPPYRRARASYNPANRTAIHIYRTFGLVEPRSGELEILTVALMRIPAFARFAVRHRLFDACDVYRQAFSFEASGVRHVDARPGDAGHVDRFDWNGQSVYPQRFAIGDDWIEVIFDAVTLSPCRVAVPEWSAEFCAIGSPSDRMNAAACLRVTNDRLSSLAVTLPGSAAPRILSRSERIEADVGLRVRSDDDSDGQSAMLSLQVADDVFDMSCWVPRRAPTGDRPRHVLELPACVRIGDGDTTIDADPNLGGRIHSLRVGSREALLAAQGDRERSLGWIYPWKGGLFTLVSQNDDDVADVFRRAPWGPWPGWVGFNTEPTGWDVGDDWFAREAAAGSLVERIRFVATSSGIRVCAQVKNVGRRDVRAAFALFAFLTGTKYDADGPPLLVCADDGQTRTGSRRSFEVVSRARVAIDAGVRRFTLSIAQGEAEASAFNLGADGVHFLARSLHALRPGEAFELAAEIRIEERAPSQ